MFRARANVSASAGFSAALFLFSLFTCVVLFQTSDVYGPSHGLGFGLSLYVSIPFIAVPAVLSTPRGGSTGGCSRASGKHPPPPSSDTHHFIFHSQRIITIITVIILYRPTSLLYIYYSIFMHLVSDYTQPSAIAPNWCRYGRAIAENAIAELNN